KGTTSAPLAVVGSVLLTMMPGPTIEPGPTGVQLLAATGSIALIVKTRKVVLAWSATSSPRPLGRPRKNWSDQPLSVPAWLPERLGRRRRCSPADVDPNAVANEWPISGRTRPKYGGPAFSIAVPALSSKIVLVKFAPPMFKELGLNRVIDWPPGRRSSPVSSRTSG